MPQLELYIHTQAHLNQILQFMIRTRKWINSLDPHFMAVREEKKLRKEKFKETSQGLWGPKPRWSKWSLPNMKVLYIIFFFFFKYCEENVVFSFGSLCLLHKACVVQEGDIRTKHISQGTLGLNIFHIWRQSLHSLCPKFFLLRPSCDPIFIFVHFQFKYHFIGHLKSMQ